MRERSFKEKFVMLNAGCGFAMRAAFMRASQAAQGIVTAQALDESGSVLISRNVYDAVRINAPGVRAVHVRQDAPRGLLERIDAIGFDNICDDISMVLGIEQVNVKSWLDHNVCAESREILKILLKRDAELQVVMSAVSGGRYDIVDQIYRSAKTDECISRPHIDTMCDVVLCGSLYGSGAQYYWGEDISDDIYKRVYMDQNVDMSAFRSSIASMWDFVVFKGDESRRRNAQDALIHNSGPGQRFTQVYEC